MGEGRVVHRVLVGKPKRKRPLGRLRCRWEDNIKMDFQEVGRGCGDWMERDGHVGRMGEGRVVYRVLVGKPDGKRT
jgi:hypothetical protein